MTETERCPLCKGSRKVYPEHLYGRVAVDDIPGYDPRVPCPACAEARK